MNRILIAVAAVSLSLVASAHAQTAKVVTTCGQAGYAAGPIQPLTQDVNGLQCHALVGPGSVAAQTSLDGSLGVQQTYPQFQESFSAALDTTTNWALKNSTGTAATSAGQLVINSSTTASAWGGVSSQQSYAPVGVGSQVFGVLASFTVTAQANSVRVFGMFTVPATPTVAVPVTDGYIYRLDGTGALFAEIWSSGVAVSSTNVTANCLPAAATPAIFAINYRSSLVQFSCGASQVVNLAPVVGINPVQQVLPISALSIAGATPPAASAVMNLSALAFASTSPGTVKSSAQAPTINDAALVVTSLPYSAGSTPLAGNAAGTTGAVAGTLIAAATNTTAYICGFNVQAIGGTAPVGPITIAGLVGSSQIYQGSASAAGGTVASQIFQPCIPASAANTNITVTTTADGTATAVDVNAWGFRQ